jgi:luciferase family oxidoreductase group 1
MIHLSILDLAPIAEGATVPQALATTTELARHAEALGYRRFWLAEHHNMEGLACSATAVLLAHVAAHTSRITLGSGGVMLPNHAPLVVAEQFGTLAALHPGRIELGLGRAPGTDGPTMRALRRRTTSRRSTGVATSGASFAQANATRSPRRTLSRDYARRRPTRPSPHPRSLSFSLRFSTRDEARIAISKSR